MNSNKFKLINKCRVCGSKNLLSILDLGQQPLANDLHRNYKKQNKYPLHLLICNSCKTSQISATINPKILFKKYLWVTNTSDVAKDHANKFRNFCNKILKKSKYKVFEVASNDGTFLKQFKKKGCQVIGIDPAKNIVDKVKGIKTINAFFDYNISKKIKKNNGCFDLVYARNVIPHVPNVNSVIKGMANLMNEKSYGAIEFHYSGKIIEELHYDSIYHEHIFYFTIYTISNILKLNYLNVFDIKKSPISGGSLIIFFSKNKIKKSASLRKMENNETIKKFNNTNSWKKFGKRSLIHSKKLKSLILKKFNNNEKKFLAYGASARSSTLLNFCKINNKFVSFVIDKNKLKNGLYTPGTNIKIIETTKISEKLKFYKVVIILAWNFEREIFNYLKKKGFKGKLIVPLPRIKTINVN